MSLLVDAVRWICVLFLIALFARMILSFMPLGYDTPLESVNRVLIRTTEPVLRPVRRLLPSPAQVGGAALDWSPLVVSLGVIIVLTLL
jgi:uncharacterized protein YggT (Ycf19 family)